MVVLMPLERLPIQQPIRDYVLTPCIRQYNSPRPTHLNSNMTRGFLVIFLYLLCFSLSSSLFWELRDDWSREKKKMKFGPEIIGARILSIERSYFSNSSRVSSLLEGKKNEFTRPNQILSTGLSRVHFSLLGYIHTTYIPSCHRQCPHCFFMCNFNLVAYHDGFRASLQYTESQCHTLCPY